jgi:hypothetical protein
VKLSKGLVGLAVLLVVFSGAAWAQDKQPDKAAIVASFKQKIQDVLKDANSYTRPEYAVAVSRDIEIPAPPAPPVAPVIVPVQGKGMMAGFVNKDGSPCKTWHTSRCYQGFTDDHGALYVNSKGVPCNPNNKPDTCTANGVTAAAKRAAAEAAAAVASKPSVRTVWWRSYAAPVLQYDFDVKVTDSLVTPYTAVLSYSQVFWSTADHSTKEEAVQDNDFTRSETHPHTATYGYQEGKWVLLK